MSLSGSISIERATTYDMEAVSELLKQTYGDEISDEQIKAERLKECILMHHCVFDVAVDTSVKDRHIIGVVWWYIHVPYFCVTTGLELEKSQVLLKRCPAVLPRNGWRDFSEEGFSPVSAEWIRGSLQEPPQYPMIGELNQPVFCTFSPAIYHLVTNYGQFRVRTETRFTNRSLPRRCYVMDKICVEGRYQNKNISEILLLPIIIHHAVQHDVKIPMIPTGGSDWILFNKLTARLPFLLEELLAKFKDPAWLIHGTRETTLCGTEYGPYNPYPWWMKAHVQEIVIHVFGTT